MGRLMVWFDGSGPDRRVNPRRPITSAWNNSSRRRPGRLRRRPASRADGPGRLPSRPRSRRRRGGRIPGRVPRSGPQGRFALVAGVVGELAGRRRLPHCTKARAMNARRRAKVQPVADVPEPEVARGPIRKRTADHRRGTVASAGQVPAADHPVRAGGQDSRGGGAQLGWPIGTLPWPAVAGRGREARRAVTRRGVMSAARV